MAVVGDAGEADGEADGEAVQIDLEIIRANGEAYSEKAKIDFIDSQADPATGTVALRLSCPNAEYRLLPGGYVQVKVSERFPAPRASVPLSAVMTDGRAQYVYVVGADNVAERRDIVPGPLAGGMQAVESGIAPGERVITGGQHKIRPGAAVNPVPAGGAAPPSQPSTRR